MAHDRLVGERQVVRRDLAGDVKAVLFGPPNKLYGACSACMSDMRPSAGETGKLDVPRDHDLLRGGGNPLESEPRRYPALVHGAAA